MNLFNVIVMIALCAAIGICSLAPCRCVAQAMDGQTPITPAELGFEQVEEHLEYAPIEQSQESAPIWDQQVLPHPYQEDASVVGNPVCPSCENAKRQMAQWQASCKRNMSHARAGCPLYLSKHAAHTYGNKYKAYYVGGGVPIGRKKRRGDFRFCNEGTWGVDYAPWYSRVAMSWSHGRLYQGGTGQYEPDHKNRPFGQTWGLHFGNRERSFPEQHGSHADHKPHGDDGWHTDHASHAIDQTNGGHQ